MFIAGFLLGLFCGAFIGALVIALAVAAKDEVRDSEPWRDRAETWDPATKAFGEFGRRIR